MTIVGVEQSEKKHTDIPESKDFGTSFIQYNAGIRFRQSSKLRTLEQFLFKTFVLLLHPSVNPLDQRWSIAFKISSFYHKEFNLHTQFL